jgi:hypothetical protein
VRSTPLRRLGRNGNPRVTTPDVHDPPKSCIPHAWQKGLGELKGWLDIHFHNGRQAGERGGLKLLVFRTANVVDNAEDVATLRKSRSEFVRPFWITEIGSHELTRKIRRRVSRHAEEFLVGRGQRSRRGPADSVRWVANDD